MKMVVALSLLYSGITIKTKSNEPVDASKCWCFFFKPGLKYVTTKQTNKRIRIRIRIAISKTQPNKNCSLYAPVNRRTQGPNHYWEEGGDGGTYNCVLVFDFTQP